jgi:hypothetical protein
MKQTAYTFSQIAEILESAKIPCVLKQYQYENGTTNFSIEFGYNWPEHLYSDTEKAFGGNIPSYIDVCGDSCGPDMIARKKIAGGQQDYFHLERWG